MYAYTGPWNHAIITLNEPQIVHPAPSRDKSRDLPTGAEIAAPRFGRVLFNSPVMVQAVQKARQVAQTPSTVLLSGETGTGKELFAQGIHEASSRANGPFVAVNCGAMPKELVQSDCSATGVARSPAPRTRADRQVRTGRQGHAVPRRNF